MTMTQTTAVQPSKNEHARAVRTGELQLEELQRLVTQMRAQLARIEPLHLRQLKRVLESLEGSLEITRDLALEVRDIAAAVDEVVVNLAPAKSAKERAAEFIASERWTPGETELQRGRAALLEEFQKPHNLPVSEYARLAGVSRQQIYKDLNATPPKLLALSVGKAGQRVPDWQLEERPLELTRLVANAAPELDAWTIYHALRTPSGALEGIAPVDAVKQKGKSASALARLVLEELGIHAESA